jgi:hypothetical protein
MPTKTRKNLCQERSGPPDCHWVHIPPFKLGCEHGAGEPCPAALLLKAKRSSFHDAALIEATEKINAILAALPPDPEGRAASFVHTKRGVLLAWVDHSGTPPASRKGAVTGRSDEATVIEALGLKIKPRAKPKA